MSTSIYELPVDECSLYNILRCFLMFCCMRALVIGSQCWTLQAKIDVTCGWFPPSRSRCRSRFRKHRVHTGRVCRCWWDVCAIIARQAQEAGRRVFRAKEWSELQARTKGRYGKIELGPVWTDERQRQTYGNGERYFLRKLRNYYVKLTYLLHKRILQRIRDGGNKALGYIGQLLHRCTSNHNMWPYDESALQQVESCGRYPTLHWQMSWWQKALESLQTSSPRSHDSDRGIRAPVDTTSAAQNWVALHQYAGHIL